MSAAMAKLSMCRSSATARKDSWTGVERVRADLHVALCDVFAAWQCGDRPR